jgi:Protein of unknown function (DUF3754)
MRDDLRHDGLQHTAQTAPPLTISDLRENFIPVSQQSLRDRLTRSSCWANGRHVEAQKFFRYLNYWRRQQYTARLNRLANEYEPFSPDSDTLVTRTYKAEETLAMRRRVMDDLRNLLVHANYTRIPRDQFKILTAGSDYGLELEVDLNIFEEIEIFFRGRTSKTNKRRSKKGFFLKSEEYDVPVFQRLCIVFKLKPFDVRVDEVMKQKRCDRPKAVKLVEKMRKLLPPQVLDNNIYVKLFKNIPQADLEMVFPNTRVKFRLLDKVRLTTTASGGIGAGAFGAAGKIAVLSANPVGAAIAAVGLGGVVFRQVMNVVNTKNKYMVTMAQSLYFHAMADNRGAMTKLADRAAEEDIKEEMLLYAVLAKEHVRRSQLKEVDEAIELYLLRTYERDINFDVSEALSRLIADGIVTERADGTLVALQPADAAKRIDKLWDGYLDTLDELKIDDEGEEFDAEDPKARPT